MSHQLCPCADLLQATDAEKKEAWDQLKAFAKEIAAQKAFAKEATAAKVKWHTDIAAAADRAMEKVNFDFNFTLCKRCVVERPEEQVPEPDSTPQ